MTHGVMAALWSASVGKKGLPLRPTSDFGVTLQPMRLSPADRDLAEKTIGLLSGVPLLRAAYEVGKLFTSLLPAAYRSRLGIYFTPPALANRLLETAEAAGANLATCRVLDPACGGGAFLVPILLRKLAELKGRRERGAVGAIAKQVKGYEIDPFAAWLSQVFAELALLPLIRDSGVSIPLLVEVRDTLASSPGESERFDLVIGNPPYSKIRLAEGWRERYGRSLFGHANLYGLFTDQALRFLAEGGVVAFVTPTSFLGGEYFKKLRSLLLAEAPPAHLEFVAERDGIFADVLQETLLAVYRRTPLDPSVQVTLLDIRGEEVQNVETCGRVPLASLSEAPWLIPRSAEQGTLIKEAGRSPYRLSDYGCQVSTGPLVWNRHKDQLRDCLGPDTIPLIWAESVASDGTFAFRADKRNHQPYLRLRGSIDQWLKISKPCVLVQRTTAKEQGRRLIAAPLAESLLARHGWVTVENHLNMVRPVGPGPKVSLQALSALLNSRIVDQLFRCISGSVAVSAYELEALPLPPPAAMTGIEKLLRNGAAPRAIERAIEKSYREELSPGLPAS